MNGEVPTREKKQFFFTRGPYVEAIYINNVNHILLDLLYDYLFKFISVCTHEGVDFTAVPGNVF